MIEKKQCVFVFDIDGTLAPFGRPIEGSISGGLRKLEANGHIICLASGKSCSYIAGLERGIGLISKFAIGENGAAILTGETKLKLMIKRPEYFDELRSKISTLLPFAYFQDNYINVAVFPERSEELDMLEKYLKTNGYYDREEIKIYRYKDAIEIVPEGISKGKALSYLKNAQAAWGERNIIAAGDGENDLSLKESADEFFVIGDGLKEIKEGRFRTIKSFMEYLLNMYS